MHERIAVNSLCFLGDDMDQLAQHFAALGTKRISLLSHQLLEDEGAAARRILADTGTTLETVTHLFAGRRTLDMLAEDAGAERAALSQAIGATAALGGGSIYMLSGGRGPLDWEAAAEAFADAIGPCVAEAKAAGVALLLEPAGPAYADIHIGHSLRDTVQLADIAGIGVNIDLSSCWTEAGLRDTIRRAAPRTGLVQVGDYALGDRTSPSRAVPGDGAVPLRRMIGWILEEGFNGGFDFELLGPRIDAEGRLEAVRRAGVYMTDLLRELGA